MQYTKFKVNRLQEKTEKLFDKIPLITLSLSRRIDIVFDLYLDNSIKKGEREEKRLQCYRGK